MRLKKGAEKRASQDQKHAKTREEGERDASGGFSAGCLCIFDGPDFQLASHNLELVEVQRKKIAPEPTFFSPQRGGTKGRNRRDDSEEEAKKDKGESSSAQKRSNVDLDSLEGPPRKKEARASEKQVTLPKARPAPPVSAAKATKVLETVLVTREEKRRGSFSGPIRECVGRYYVLSINGSYQCLSFATSSRSGSEGASETGRIETGYKTALSSLALFSCKIGGDATFCVMFWCSTPPPISRRAKDEAALTAELSDSPSISESRACRTWSTQGNQVRMALVGWVPVHSDHPALRRRNLENEDPKNGPGSVKRGDDSSAYCTIDTRRVRDCLIAHLINKSGPEGLCALLTPPTTPSAPPPQNIVSPRRWQDAEFPSGMGRALVPDSMLARRKRVSRATPLASTFLPKTEPRPVLVVNDAMKTVARTDVEI
ncbi:hypothetical protein DFH07DRAFT_945274 [Mycena maculata]|uniref:Uncharacterized protein n=1 Tax=Mycena maculata TaxID=230809 RepID=A0AAD7HYH7_9AGAR|nr:hypothetical protein DFH07DRAFT_945274 [Mycena maculata]